MMKVSDYWYKDFFQGLNCELWERAVTPEWTQREVDFLTSELNVQAGQAILDIPCGFGRHAIALAQSGYQVTGIDISETFLKPLNEKIRIEKLNILTIQADILSVKIDKTFSGAICMGNSFGYFNFEKMKSFVEKVSSKLEPAARFIIHSNMMAESTLPDAAKDSSYTFGDLTMQITQEYDMDESCWVIHILYTKAGKKEEHIFKHYVFTLAEVKRLLQQYGLTTIKTYSTTEKANYQLGDPQIYLIAEKQCR